MAGARYGGAHQRLRAEWKPKVEAGGVHCHRCEKPIAPGAKWHLDHHDDGSGSSPSHAACNVRTSGIWKEKAELLQKQVNGESTYGWF